MHRILMVAVEAKPYATAGGTSDVVGALARVLQGQGHDVRLVLPQYGAISRDRRHRIEQLAELQVPVGGEPLPAPVGSELVPAPVGGELAPAPVGSELAPAPVGGELAPATISRADQHTYLVGGDPFGYFARAGLDGVPVYPTLEDDSVDAGELYAFFCRAVLELVTRFRQDGWQPDIIHCHDWPTGLLPIYLKRHRKGFASAKDPRVVFTIHNMSDVVYQGGWFDPELLAYAGLPKSLFRRGPVRHRGHVNFIKAGIVFSDRVNTVSEGYAREISSGKAEAFVTLDGARKRFKCSGGLDRVWTKYQVNLVGIRNGIDDAYDPARIGEGEDWQFIDQDWMSSYAPAQGQSIAGWAYDGDDPALGRKKQDLKRYLQERCNRLLDARLEVSAEVPVIAVRSRLTEQKGFDLIIRALRQWSPDLPAQFIIVAWGEERYANHLRQLAAANPQWLVFSESWKVAPEPLHYAAADMLLMPSLFEPCGLPHMMALRYGTIPIVRNTGGLADVVQDFDPESGTGNGFVFDAPSSGEMLHAVGRALETYHRQPDHWRALQKTAMRARDRNGNDFTWTTAAGRYLAELYSF